MASISIHEDLVEIKLSLMEEIFSLHGSLKIPLRHIAEVSAAPVPVEWFRGLRFGTSLPGLYTAASFLTSDGWMFYDIRHGERCLTFELTHERYKKVVIEVDAASDPQRLAAEIETARAKA